MCVCVRDEFTIKYLLNLDCVLFVQAAVLYKLKCDQMSVAAFLCEDARLDWLLSGSDFSRFSEPSLNY